MNPFITDRISVTLNLDTEQIPALQSSLAFLADMCYTYGDDRAEGYKKHYADALGYVLQISSVIGEAILDQK